MLFLLSNYQISRCLIYLTKVLIFFYIQAGVFCTVWSLLCNYCKFPLHVNKHFYSKLKIITPNMSLESFSLTIWDMCKAYDLFKKKNIISKALFFYQTNCKEKTKKQQTLVLFLISSFLNLFNTITYCGFIILLGINF